MEIKTSGKRGKFLWVTVKGSTLFTYTSADQVDFKKKYELAGSTIEDSSVQFSFAIKQADKDLFTLSATSKNDCEGWRAFIAHASSKAPGSPPVKEKATKKKLSLAMKASKNIGGMIATSKAGKKAVNVAIPDELRELIVALKRVISVYKDRALSDEVETCIIKVLFKTFVLEREKIVEFDQFLQADAPLREAFEVLIFMRDNEDRLRPETIDEKLALVSRFLQQVQGHLVSMLLPHVQPKTIKRISVTFGLLSSTEFLAFVWTSPVCLEEKELLVDAMNRYTQFNF